MKVTRPKVGILVNKIYFVIILLLSFIFFRLEGNSPEQKVPQHDAAAIIKLITVRVLDQDGQPVTGLKKEDFVLYDNGKKKSLPHSKISLD